LTSKCGNKDKVLLLPTNIETAGHVLLLYTHAYQNKTKQTNKNI